MTTQWLTVSVIAGDAATAAAAKFQSWLASPVSEALDHFCEQLRRNGASLPVVYHSEWVDRWLMGNLVPGPSAVEGRRFEASCLTPEQAALWADRCGSQFPEQQWLAARLREAAESWEALVRERVVVVTREVLGASTTDDEVRATLQGIPDWLAGC